MAAALYAAAGGMLADYKLFEYVITALRVRDRLLNVI